MQRRVLIGGLAGLPLARIARAQDAFPSRPVRLIAPFPPGGSSDLLSRATAEGLTRLLGQPVIVDNRTGAGGTIGLTAVARAAPDGYTLGFAGIGSLVQSAGVYAGRLQFDVEKDFAPVGLMGATAVVIVASARSGLKTLGELVERARRNPGRLAYGSAGVGGSLHLAAELLQRQANVQMEHVPYRGGGPALTDVMGGQIGIAFLDTATIIGQIANPDIKVLAVASRERFPSMPDVPTTAEAGFPQLVVEIWLGMVAPRATPQPVVARLEAASQAIAAGEEFHRFLFQNGFRPYPGGSARFAAEIKQDLATWLPLIQAANIRGE